MANTAKTMTEEEKYDRITKFFDGRDPLERITSIECSYTDDTASVIYWDENWVKRIKIEDFKPFVWAKHSVCIRMFSGDRKRISWEMERAGIGVKALRTSNTDSISTLDRLKNGYRFLFYAKRKMSYNDMLQFFQRAGTPVYGRKKSDSGSKEFLAFSPVEQHMMYTGKRLFKGMANYDDCLRFLFDLETTGLNPKKDCIDQIGMRTNKGFEKIITIEGEGEERKKNELAAMREFFKTWQELTPDVVAGHNSEKFDIPFMETRCIMDDTTLEELSGEFFRYPVSRSKKESVLKLGGEVEYYRPTKAWGVNVLDSLHAVRRAQASDSSMESGNLKYVTDYLKLKKKNRVYIPGNKIKDTWRNLGLDYEFNESTGDWKKIGDKEPREGYTKVTGRYIGERYLKDDLYETDKVELKMNECNFLINKMIPTNFQRACTMGTAAIWKLIVVGWCLENGLAIPAFGQNKRFTGGLSRLLRTGRVGNVVKLDYNSLYPSILITFDIINEYDVDGIMLSMLEYVLTQREKYKELKKIAGKKADEIKEKLDAYDDKDTEICRKLIDQMNEYYGESTANDKKQLPLKTLGNSYFGANGAPNVFPFGNTVVAEKTTCIGRMQLRLMIGHFSKLGYCPIVGDSFTGDTPLFVKRGDGTISVEKIEDLFDEEERQIDELGREYDTSKKGIKVLCASGWVEPTYIYRHKTDKSMYDVSDGGMRCEVTADHSLFDDDMAKVNPSSMDGSENLKYVDYSLIGPDENKRTAISDSIVELIVKLMILRKTDVIPSKIMSADRSGISKFLEAYDSKRDKFNNTKRLDAGIQYLRHLTKEI